MENYKLYTDGSLATKLNIAAIGGYLLDPNNNIVFEFSEKIENKELFRFHESLALLYGLDKAIEHGVTNLECFSDDISIMKLFNKESLTEESIKTNPVRKDIFAIKNKFESIYFNHLPRKQNKIADKLAGKHLKTYKEKFTVMQKRKHFYGQEANLLFIPNLICEEDFHDNGNLNKFVELKNPITHYFLFDIKKTDQVVFSSYLIQKESQGKIKTTLINSEAVKQHQLFNRGFELMTQALEQHQPSNDVGIIFNCPSFLRQIEGVLRKRALLKDMHFETTAKFVNVTKNYKSIILHNEQKIISKYNSPSDQELINIEVQDKINHYINILKELSDDNWNNNAELKEKYLLTTEESVVKTQKKFFGEFLKVSLYALKLSLPTDNKSINIHEKMNELKFLLKTKGIKLKI